MVIRYPAERNSLPYLLSPRAERRLSVRKNTDPGSNFIRRTAHAQLSQPLTALDPAAAARVARWATSRLISGVGNAMVDVELLNSSISCRAA